MILISLLLVIILSLLLQCTLKRFRKKNRSRDTASEAGRESRVSSPTNIIRARLDHDMPYAPLTGIAPPSYEDTLLADQMVQEDSAPEYTVEGNTVTVNLEGGERDITPSSSADSLLPSEGADVTTESDTTHTN